MSNKETQVVAQDATLRRSKPKKVSASRAAEIRRKEEVVPRSVPVNIGLWLVTLGSVVGGSIYNAMFANDSLWLRFIIVVICVVVGLGAFAFTNQGRKFVRFAIEAALELKKIYWPTRKEALQTCVIVVIVCVLCSFAFWFMDSVIHQVVDFLISY